MGGGGGLLCLTRGCSGWWCGSGQGRAKHTDAQVAGGAGQGGMKKCRLVMWGRIGQGTAQHMGAQAANGAGQARAKMQVFITHALAHLHTRTRAHSHTYTYSTLCVLSPGGASARGGGCS